MRTLERIARKICESCRDDPDVLAYPPMVHPVANGIRHVTIAPAEDYCQPKPLWNWYLPMAEAAVRALESNPPIFGDIGKRKGTLNQMYDEDCIRWSEYIRAILHEKETSDG